MRLSIDESVNQDFSFYIIIVLKDAWVSQSLLKVFNPMLGMQWIERSTFKWQHGGPGWTP